MPTPLLPDDERLRRKNLVEDYLQDGYTPLGQRGGKGAACNAAHLFDGVNYHRWVASEIRERDAGRPSFIPDWSLYKGPVASTSAKAATVRKPSNDNTPLPTPKESADLRAKLLADEVTSLVTRSNYPVINPEAIVVDSHLSRRFNAKTGEYRDVESTPRTWLSETLMVEPHPDARNRRFIFTAAQNDAPVHDAFWANLQAYAAYLDAEVVVGAYTYETQWWSENNPMSRSYDPALTDSLCFGQMVIGDEFVFAGEMNTIPTASQPISDLLTYSKNRWAVFPHAKRQLKSVPSTDPNVQAHQVMTTGSVTRPKVIPRKAGVKSLFHQVIGAVVVEFDQDANIFARQITATDDGAFYDLDRHVSDATVTDGHRARSVVVGDLHLRKVDATNAMAIFGFDPAKDGVTYKDNLLSVLNPDFVFLHDVFDHESRNHHHADDSHYLYEMHVRGRESVLSEIVQLGHFLERAQAPGRQVMVVESNHDIGLDRYIKDGRYRSDPPNLRIGLKLEELMIEARQKAGEALDRGEAPEHFSLLEAGVRLTEAEVDGIQWAYDNTSFLVDGIEHAHHGFRGVNGSKGTIQGFARTGRKLSIGDKHSPEINEGVYVAGALQLQMGYNKGPSSWAVACIAQYPDGNRSILTLQRGRWRADRPRISVPARKAA